MFNLTRFLTVFKTILMMLILINIFVLQSCKVFYHRVHFEHIYKPNALITKETKIKTTGRNCRSKEITTEKDLLANLVVSKEVISYTCMGAYSYEVKRKTWTRVHGKKDVTVTKRTLRR